MISLPNSPAEEWRLNVGPEPDVKDVVRSLPMMPKAVFALGKFAAENLRIWASTDGEGFVEEATDPALLTWRFSFRDLTSLAGSGIWCGKCGCTDSGRTGRGWGWFRSELVRVWANSLEMCWLGLLQVNCPGFNHQRPKPQRTMGRRT